jgi:tetratricopeptide (TPR) repeat protein
MVGVTMQRCWQWQNNRILWRQTLKTTPSSYRALIYLGSEYAQRHDFVKALDCYKQALRACPNRDNLILIYYNQAIVFLRMGEEHNARSCLHKLLETYPGYAPAWILLGDMAAMKKMWEEALALYDKSGGPKNDWDQGYAYFLDKKGNCFMALAQWHKASQVYMRAMKYAPHDPSFYAKSGFAHIQIGCYTIAEQHLKRGLMLQERSYHIHYMLHILYSRQKNGVLAEYHYQRARQLSPSQKLPSIEKSE